jgi:NAD(P)-dependent dehydrogenase (short-subunit alcohol dehydrogenase family)
MSGRVVIVTGASKGIGRVISQVLGGEGAAVVCAARTADLVEETAAIVTGLGGRAIAVAVDLATEDGARLLVERAVDAFGHLDGLVNNAGDGGPTKPIGEYSLADWRYTLDSCLTSSFLCTRAAVPAMMRAQRGAIVNISSMAGRRGMPYRVGYCAAKAGQAGMTYGLALELGPHNITINTIMPGAVEGDRIDRMIAGQAEVRGTTPEAVRQGFIARSPLKRLTAPDDIAWTTLFLLSDHARAISGQCLPVNAGEPAS